MQNTHVDQLTPVIYPGQAPRKKILFACVPGDGHFSPLTGIAKHLQSMGYDVRWYCSSSYREKIQKLDIPFYPFDAGLEVTGETADQVFPERTAIKSAIKKLNYDIIHFFIRRGPEYYADMVNIYRSFPFDLVIADCAFTGIPFVTDKMNIPVVSIGVFPLTESSKDLAPSGLAITPSYSFAGKIKQRIMHWVANKFLFKVSNEEMKRVMGEYGIDCNNASLFDLMIQKSDLLLQSGTPGFEYKRSDLGKNIRFVGPLLPYARKGKKEQWFDQKLHQYKHVVLVTQGTVERDTEKILVPTLEAFKDSDTLVIATTGGSQTKELQARFPHQNIIIADFIPFADVMPHADVYITNGGYGGVMLGIENHLPLVVAGIHEGKNEINARVGYFKLGINLKTEKPSPDQIRKAVTEVISNGIYKKNIKNLSKEFKAYDTYKLCAAYVEELLQSSVKPASILTDVIRN